MLKGCRNAYALRHPCFCVKSGLPFLERPLFNYYFDRVKVNDVERECGLQRSNNLRLRLSLSPCVITFITQQRKAL